MATPNRHDETDDISLSDIIDFLLRIKYFLLIAGITAAAGAFVQHAKNPRFISSALVQVQKSSSSPLQALSEKFAGITGGSGADNELENTKDFFVSRELYRLVAKKILEGSDAQQIQKDLATEALPEERVVFQSEAAQMALADRLSELAGAETISKESIRIWVKANSPETTIKVVNLLLETGVQALAESHASELSNATNFVSKKLQELEVEIKSRQNIVLDLRRKIGLSTGQTDLKDLSNPANRLKETLANAEAELRQRQNLIKMMKPQVDSGHTDYSFISKYEKLVDERKFWQTAVQSLSETLKNWGKNDKDSSAIEQNLLYANREIEFQYRFYGDLKNQLLQTELMKISIMNRVRPLEAGSASSTFRTSGVIDSYLPVSALLAMILTSFLMFFLESIYPVVRNPHQLGSFPLFFLGEVPDFGPKNLAFFKNLVSSQPPESHLLWKDLKTARIGDSPEAMVFRTLRSKIQHLNETGGGKVRVICVTSPRGHSGKTMITANLGCLFSVAKKKTLVIDCDLRHGEMTSGFELEGRSGLTDYLSGNILDVKSIIEPVTSHLHVLPRGTSQPNIAEILSDDQLPALLEELKNDYDYILLDSSQLLGHSEADIVSKSADMVLLSLVQQETKMSDMKFAMEQLTFNDVKKIGYVLNRSTSHTSQAFLSESKAA